MKKLWVLFLLLFITSADAKTYDLNTVVIKALRSDEELARVNRPVSVITSEDIARSSAKTLPELLGSSVGVYGQQYGNIKNSFVDLRGSGENSTTSVLVLVDGRRTNQIDLSGQDWAQIDLSSVDHIEIIRGSGAVLYGDNANSGVINIVTKKGSKSSKPSITLASQYGRYQTSKHGIEVSGGLKQLDYQLNYSHQETTGYRAQSNYWGNDLSSHLNYEPTDNFNIDFSQGYHLDRYQLPGALFPSNINQYGRRGVRPSLNNDHGWTSDSHFDVTPKLKLDVGTSDIELSLFSTARKRNNKFFTGTTVYETQSLTNSYEFQPKFIMNSPLTDAVGNKLTGGYDYFYGKSARRSGTLGTPQDQVYISKVTHGIYFLDELSFDEKWLLNAGARRSWTDYVFDQKQVIASKSSTETKNKAVDAGLGYQYNPQSKVYANFSRSYRLPATDEFFQNVYDFGGGPQGGFNTNLTYQTGNHVEVGIKDQSIKDVQLGLNFFAAQYKKEFYFDPVAFVNSNYNGKTRHYGLETEASVELWDNHVVPYINWTVQEANFRDGVYGGKEIPFVPDQLLNLGVNVRPFDSLTTGLSMNYVGERFAISDVNNTQPKLKRYATLDWHTSYGYKNIELWLGLRNILATEYYAYGVYNTFANDTGYYPAPGRDVSAGVKVKF